MNYSKLVKSFCDKLEIFINVVAIIIVLRGIIKALYIIINDYQSIESTFIESRIILCESISLALSFILTIEVVKIMYITKIEQIGIVFMLVILKIIIHYFVDQDIEKYNEEHLEKHKDK